MEQWRGQEDICYDTKAAKERQNQVSKAKKDGIAEAVEEPASSWTRHQSDTLRHSLLGEFPGIKTEQIAKSKLEYANGWFVFPGDHWNKYNPEETQSNLAHT